MSLYYERCVRLTGMDVDGRGICKASGLLNHLQVAAILAAEEGGFGREILMNQYGAFWMLARSWFRLERPVRWEEEVTVCTWHRGGKTAMMYRDYDILADGQPVGESVSTWVLAGVEGHKLLRLGDIRELEGTDGGERRKTRLLAKLRAPEQIHEVERRLMRYSDTDINGHVNNIRYADFACDTLELDRQEETAFISEMQIGYLAECRPGDQLILQAGELERGHYIRGLDESGKSRFETALFFGEVVP